MAVVPTKAGENHRQVTFAVSLAPFQVLLPALAGMVAYSLERFVPAHGPRAYDVGLTNDPVQSGVVHAVGIERAPAARHTHQDGVAAVLLIALEELHQPLALGQRVLAPVVEADAPDGYNRLAAMP